AGNLKHPLPPLTDVVLRAIQAARKTAENAINLKRVEDQVNNAVIAANKAA
ncbi:MORN repeat-containing protein 1-like, partial [Trifolium medium]|nr:MORN repeat-containing protein 1-like [Trifolium medium]